MSARAASVKHGTGVKNTEGKSAHSHTRPPSRQSRSRFPSLSLRFRHTLAQSPQIHTHLARKQPDL